MKKVLLVLFSVFIGFTFIGCDFFNNPGDTTNTVVTTDSSYTTHSDTTTNTTTISCNSGYEYNVFSSTCELIDIELGIEDNDTFYQLLVYSFSDSDGDGIGDFKGIAEKVDYFKYLGVEALWLSPIHPSPSYHHYDVMDYYSTDSRYVVDGFTFDDMMTVLNDNGIDVILDMVVNHSSNQHPYFVEAVDAFRNGTQSEYIDYYIFDNEPFTHPTLGYDSAQIDGVYYDAFYGFSSMPAFNYDNPAVKDMFVDIFSYWLDKGVVGFRLDASKHIYDDITLNNEVFNYFVTELEKDYDDVYFVNEVWSDEDEIVAYYDSTMSNFNFALKDQIRLALEEGERSYGYYLEHFQDRIREMSLESVEANFVSNHDIGRLGLSYTIEQQKMIAAMNILAPGNSFVFYGDELSLEGDRYGNAWDDMLYRTPMLWDSTTEEYPGYFYGAYTSSNYNVEDEINNPNSLLNTYKELIDLKESLPVFSTGDLSGVNLHEDIISYQILSEEQNILVLHNLDSIPHQVDNTSMTRILGYVSQSSAPVLGETSLTIPPLSSIVVEISEAVIGNGGNPWEEQLSKAYIYGTFTDWIQNSNYLMTENDGVYTYNLVLNETAEFKVVIEGQYYGYDVVISGAELGTGSLEYGNIVLGPGSYIITFSNGEITIQLSS